QAGRPIRSASCRSHAWTRTHQRPRPARAVATVLIRILNRVRARSVAAGGAARAAASPGSSRLLVPRDSYSPDHGAFRPPVLRSLLRAEELTERGRMMEPVTTAAPAAQLGKPAIAGALNLTDQQVRDVKKRACAALKIALDGTIFPGRRQP